MNFIHLLDLHNQEQLRKMQLIAKKILGLKKIASYKCIYFRNNGQLDVSRLDKYNDWDNTKYQEYLKR